MSKLQIDNSHFSFRSMLKSDVVSVMEIERTIYEFPWTAGNFKDCLESGYQCDILIFKNEISGYAVQMKILDDVHLLNVSVAKNFQNIGVGRFFLDNLIAESKKIELKKMVLEVRRSNSPALCLYDSLGFSEIGIRKNYYPNRNGREDAIIMGATL